MRRYCILIVDDERVVASALELTVKAMGHEVLAIASIRDEALAACALRRPDIVLFDIRLAGEVDGIDTAQELADLHGLRVIYLTAHEDVGLIERAKRTRPYAYLLKPIKDGELQAAIEIAMFERDQPS